MATQQSYAQIQQKLRSLSPEVTLPALVFGILFLCGVIYTLLQPRLYQSHARLWVLSRIPNDYSGGAGGHPYAPFYNSFTSAMTTASEVVRCQSVLKEAREMLSRQENGPLPSIDEIRGGLKVTPVREADILEVAYANKSPAVAAAVLRAVVESFMKTASSQNTGNTKDVFTFLTNELREAQKSYARARQKLAEFQDSKTAVNLTEQTTELLRQQSEISSDLKNARTQVAETGSRLSFLQREAGVSAENAINVETLTSDEVVQELKAKIAAQQVRLVEMRTKYMADNPQLKRTESALQKLEQALANRVSQLSRQPGNSAYLIEDIQNAGPLKRGILEELVRARGEELAQQTRVESLLSSAAEIDAKLKSIPAEQMELAGLATEAQLAETRLTDVQHRLQSATLAESLTNRQSNIKMIDEPDVPSQPATPNVPLDLLVAFAIALGGGGGTWYMIGLRNPRVASAGEVSGILPYSVSASFRARRRDHVLDEMIHPMDRLRHTLASTWLKSGHKSIVVMGAGADDDKDLVAAGLAESFARSGLRVALIDTNLHNPNLHTIFAVDSTPGLVQRLAGNNADISGGSHSILRRITSNLNLIAAGASQGRAYGLWLHSPAFQQLIAALDKSTDVFIFDTSPVSVSLDALSLLKAGAQALIVVKLGQTRSHMLRYMARELRQQSIEHAAIVLGNADDVGPPPVTVVPAPPDSRPSDLPANTVAGW